MSGEANRATLQQINDIISKTENGKWAESTIEEIKDLLMPLLESYVNVCPSLSFETDLYRGIKYRTKPTFLDELSYPPIDKAKVGRANREGVQVFYCTSQKSAVFYELKSRVGETMAIAQWYVDKIVEDDDDNLDILAGLEVKRLGLIVNRIGYTSQMFDELGSYRDPSPFANYETKAPEVTKESNLLIQTFLAKNFCQDINEGAEQIYKLTNAIAELHTEDPGDGMRNGEMVGISYPTIRMNANADNLAIHKEAVDVGFIKFERVEFIEVLGTDGTNYQYKILDIADEIKDGKLIWKSLQQTWTIDTTRDLYFASDDDRICAFDLNGNLIEPDES